MPIYEYMCDKCSHEFEREQRITEDPVKTCPKCRSRRVKKLISRTSFVLKGSGWYSDLYSSPKTDSMKGGDSESASSESKSEKESEKKGEKKGETKKASGDKASKQKSGDKSSGKSAA